MLAFVAPPTNYQTSTGWVHQLGGYSWASPERYRCGNVLTEELGRLARQMVHLDD